MNIVQAVKQAIKYDKQIAPQAGGLAVRTNLRAGDSAAQGAAIGAPGVLSGNLPQIPIHAYTGSNPWPF